MDELLRKFAKKFSDPSFTLFLCTQTAMQVYEDLVLVVSSIVHLVKKLSRL
jgi:hypothetical protein